VRAVRFVGRGGQPRIGRLEDDYVVDQGPAGPRGFVPTDSAWSELLSANGEQYAIENLRLLPPVDPIKIMAMGLNYRSHVEEAGLSIPETPVIFAKLPSSLSGPYDDIVVPREETRPDFEGEVALVIGKCAYRVEAEHGWSYVGGITALNDVSGRRAQFETPMVFLGKSFDTFTPIGPSIASPDSVDRDSISLRTILSGEVMQESSTADLLFAVPVLIDYMTRGITLEPGDIVATGTPGGIGDQRDPPRYLREGDVLVTEVGGVGELRNRVRFEK
jgi:2-keto-4-pentenoate hydratase/2-oxohepta-3-ene-1,7-dioic acid hydratase in catechol pathway